MTNQFSVLLGVLRYEFRMQLRRRSLWIAMGLVGAMQILIYSRSGHLSDYYKTLLHTYPLASVVGDTILNVGFLLPAVFGALLADRLPRDRRTKVEEIFLAMPGALSTRIVGKYLGSMLATLIPMLVFYGLAVGYLFYLSNNVMVVPLALAMFFTVVLPGILFISAFSIACPAIMWVPLYQFCFIGYWFWGNMLSPRQGIPTLSHTILTPVGDYMANGFYGSYAGGVQATPLQGVESMLLLIGLAAFVLWVVWGLLKWQQARQ